MNTAIAAAKSANAWFQQKGDSMSPTIRDREWVEVDPNITRFEGPGIYVTDWKNFVPTSFYPRRVPALRRLDYIDGELHSVNDNPVVPAFKVKLDDLLIGGKAVGQS